MVYNRTNFKRLEKFFNTFDYNQYIGKQIVLNVEEVKSPHRDLSRSTKVLYETTAKKTKQKLTDEMLDKAKQALESGRTTISKISAMYEINDNQLKELKDAEVKSK